MGLVEITLIVVGVAVYLCGIPIAARLVLKYAKREWPSLPIDGGDYPYAGFVGVLWPAHLIVFGAWRLVMQPFRLIGWLARER